MKTLIALGVALTLGSAALAQTNSFPAPVAKRVAAPAQAGAIPLPGFDKVPQREVWNSVFGQTWVRNVTRPTLTPYLPKPGTANGAAVLVVPGGGFQFVSMSNEGWPVAQWLADRGIAAFVLKYRVDTTPDDDAAFAAALQARMAARAGKPLDPMDAPAEVARTDAQAALRMIRARATEWGVDPKRVGMLGFSAGARTTMATVVADAADARPDFIAPIYGFMTPVKVPAQPQPLFAALASDDPLFGRTGFALIEGWEKAGGKVELHYYSGGSHGFGSQKMGTTSDLWFDQFMAWMTAQGLLKAK